VARDARRDLVSDSLVYRYNPEASPDGLCARAGTFSICSFWYAEALARAGRLVEARLALEKMFTYTNYLGPLARPIGTHRRATRQLPPTFTQFALIIAAVNLDRQLG
jgi:GH15 family glucan-1,4-alpha-glucosidase